MGVPTPAVKLPSEAPPTDAAVRSTRPSRWARSKSAAEADLSSGEVQADLSDLLDDDLAERVARNFADYQALAERDARNVEHLQRELQPKAVIRIPYLDEDVHDLEALLKIDRYLFASEEQREELATSGAA